MAHSLSAKKRIRQNVKSRARNRWRNVNYRTAMKDYHELILHGSVEDTKAKLNEIYHILDHTASKGAIHPNKAARHKSRLTARLNAKAAG